MKMKTTKVCQIPIIFIFQALFRLVKENPRQSIIELNSKLKINMEVSFHVLLKTDLPQNFGNYRLRAVRKSLFRTENIQKH